MANRHLKILVIEDDKDDYLIIKDLLSESQAFGFDLDWARDYDAGIETIFGGLHDICLLDYKLDDRDGLELLHEVRGRGSSIPVIFMTGHGDYEVDVEAMRLGATDFLVKGRIDADQLERSIRYSIERKRAEKELRKYRDKLENLVAERTAQLEQTNRSLQLEISERVKAEEERARLVIAIEQAGEGIIVTDLNGDIEYVNPAFERISGYSRNDLMCRNVRVLKSGEQDDAFYSQMNATLRRGQVWKGRIVNRKKNGTLYEVEVTISPVKDCTGAVVNYVGIHRDITHEAVLERHLRQTQKMEAMGTMAGGIAHNFNNILAVITGHTELALLGLPQGLQIRQNLNRVLQASSAAADLVKQIITYSRMGDQEKMPVSAVFIVKEALKLLHSSLPTTIEIARHISISAEEAMIMADPTQIHQLLMNLSANAAHAMRPQGGILRVEVAPVEVDGSLAAQCPDLKTGPHVMIAVSDTGPGIDPGLIDRIFDPYFTTKKLGDGTGMGLAVVQGIVRNYGGGITVHSEQGKGATFRVYLPTIKGVVSHAAEEAEIVPKGSERILFVDDEAGLTMLAKEMLESLGYHVTPHTNSLEALRVFHAHPDAFDLVVSDMTMPGLTGVALAKELLAIRPGIPIVICTGYSEELTEEAIQGTGIRELLMKPASRREMAKVIRRALQGQ